MQIKNPSLLQKLEKAGFNSKEALVYTSLLELGGSYPSRIAEYCGLKRSTVYNILVTLSIRGLINEIEKRNKLFYQIEKPEKVVKYTESRIRRAEEESEKMKSILPDIEGLFGSLGTRPKVTYFENIDGILSIYEDMITTDKKYELLAFSNTKELENILPEKFFENFRRSKESNGITARGIVPDTKGDRTFNDKFFKGYKKEIVPNMKYVSREQFPYKGEIVIYGDNKVAIINLSREHLTGTIIEDETIHGMMKMMFELSWNSKQVIE
jgi:sugar-specific transcriptional regulator TrmB